MYAKAQATDKLCIQLIEFCTSGWPSRNQLSRELKDYWKYRGSLTLTNGLLLYQTRIVVPSSLRQQTLHKIHLGHQGIQRCRLRVASSVWWPGVTSAIEQFVLGLKQIVRSFEASFGFITFGCCFTSPKLRYHGY